MMDRKVTGVQTAAFGRRGMESHWRILSKTITWADWPFRKITGAAMWRITERERHSGNA